MEQSSTSGEIEVSTTMPDDANFIEYQERVTSGQSSPLIKLKSHGMGESIVNWVRNWLSG